MIDLDRFVADDYDRVLRSVAIACGNGHLAAEAVHEAIARASEADRPDEARYVDLRRAVATLPLRQRQAFTTFCAHLRYFLDITYRTERGRRARAPCLSAPAKRRPRS